MKHTTVLLAIISTIFVYASDALQDNCWSEQFNIPCCKEGTSAIYEDEDGLW